MDKIKKGFGPYDRQPRKNLHTAISVNKPKLSVTKHDQTLILAHMYDKSRYTANTKIAFAYFVKYSSPLYRLQQIFCVLYFYKCKKKPYL